MRTTARELVAPYLDSLGAGFYPAVDPEGIDVLGTPFSYPTHGPVEVAVWRENGHTMISDRGGAFESLLSAGLDPIESESTFAEMIRAAEFHGAAVDGCAILKRVTDGHLGATVHDVIQASLDAHALGRASRERAGAEVEPQAFQMVRAILADQDTRYLEQAVALGSLGRVYRLDFKVALFTNVLIRAAIVVIAHSALALAERWNFRFRDMGARQQRKRVVVVDEATPWSRDAHRTIVPECERVFVHDEVEGLWDYLSHCRAAPT